MKLTEFCDVADVELDVKRYPNQNERWTAQFHGAEVKEGGCLASIYGGGGSPLDAIADYIRRIEGATIVLHAMSPDLRRSFIVPKGLEV